MSSHELQALEQPLLHLFADDCKPVRLLHLDLSDDPSAEIQCSTFPVNLLDNPEFKALSYVWGAPTTLVPITVNDQRYNVTPNCHAALRALRKAGESPLWVDSICINQKDNAEKATQIPLMGEIYSQAQEVIVWLGYNDAERAPDYEAKERLALGLLADLDNDDWVNIDTRDDALLKIGMYGEFPALRWSALNDVYNHPWFSRLWVHQEAALAKQCEVLFHNHTVSYLDLVVVATILKKQFGQMQDPPPFMDKKSHNEFHETLARVQWRAWPTIRKLQLDQGVGPPINDLTDARSLQRDLLATTFFDCSDPRDHVYGILGMAQQSKEVKERIKVDYGLSVAEVYTNVARVSIETSNSLEIILGAGRISAEIKIGDDSASELIDLRKLNRPTTSEEILRATRIPPKIENREDFPSWVVDWRNRLDAKPNLRHYLYNAAAGTKSQFSFTIDGFGLDIKGLSVDCILGSTEPLDLEKIYSPDGALGLKFWEENFDVYPTGCTPGFAWLRTITIDVEASTEAHTRQSKQGRAQFALLYEYSEISLREDELDEFMERAFPRDGKTPDERAEWITSRIGQFGVAALNVTYRRTFFITRSGYMGMASNPVLRGDSICIAAGCNIPLVVREEGDHHFVIGECFVWGLMDGEYGDVLTSMQEQDTLETFRLR